MCNGFGVQHPCQLAAVRAQFFHSPSEISSHGMQPLFQQPFLYYATPLRRNIASNKATEALNSEAATLFDLIFNPFPKTALQKFQPQRVY